MQREMFDSEPEPEEDSRFEPIPPIEFMRNSIERRRRVVPAWSNRPKPVVDYDSWGVIQQRAIDETMRLRAGGDKSVVGCGVTGFGKTRVAEGLLGLLGKEESTRAAFYTHRKMLLFQTHKRFEAAGIEHGVVASDMPHLADSNARVQLVMVQTARARMRGKGVVPADFVIWDEHHANAKGGPREMFDAYHKAGAFQLGLTATPVNLGHVEKLVYFGRPSEMRKIGAIVPATVAVPAIVDCSGVRKLASGEYVAGEVAKRFMVQQVVGNIYDHWLELNRERRPTLGFAPDVESSRWLVDEAWKLGIAACAIDGTAVYFGEKRGPDRVLYSGEEARSVAQELSRDGTVSIVWNRMVFAMGVDWPWLEHVIFATKIGTVQFWIQACGRGLRAFPDSGKVGCLIQDHGGNAWEHPSPNSDIEWELGDTSAGIKEEREKGREEGKVKDPYWCQYCKLITSHEVFVRMGRRCAHCKKEAPRRRLVVPVIQLDKPLRLLPVDWNRPAVKPKQHPAQKAWNDLYYSSRNAKNGTSTFNQIRGRFNKEFGDKYQVTTARFGPLQGQTIIYEVATKQAFRLSNAPAPDSSYWNANIGFVKYSDLQTRSDQ